MSPRLYKRGRIYWADIFIGGKRVRTPLSSDRRVADEKLADLVKDREAQRYGHQNHEIRWPALKKKFFEWARGAMAAATYSRTCSAISSLEKFDTISWLRDINPELLDRWKSARKLEGRGHATINRDLRAIISFVRKAHEWGYGRGWRPGSVKKLREARGRLLFYSPEDAARLLEVCRSRFSGFYNWTTIALLGLRAGLRRSEIYWLAWEDVDLKRGTISIVPKDGWIPKSGEQRHIPIPDDLRRHLSHLHGKRSKWVMGPERPPLKVMSAFFRKISRKAKLDGNIHTLRHTYASWLVQNGVDLWTVSKLLGHTDPNMTARYAHLAPRTLEDAITRLPNVPLFVTHRGHKQGMDQHT